VRCFIRGFGAWGPACFSIRCGRGQRADAVGLVRVALRVGGAGLGGALL
jgi:hypothetical protein